MLAVTCCVVAVMVDANDGANADGLSPRAPQSTLSCSNKFQWIPTKLELSRILASQEGWIQESAFGSLLRGHHYMGEFKPSSRARARDARAHPMRANLCNADLLGANLSHADLSGADLSHAGLADADLSGADLSHAELSGAVLIGADLTGTNLEYATLRRANLFSANLSHADLGNADLSDADLTFTQLNKTKLAYVVLTDATYAPESESPDLYVAGIKGLETLKLDTGEEVGLVQLRKLLQDAGLRYDERAATYSIEKAVTRDRFLRPFWSFAWIEGIGRFIGFDLTTAYGLHPAYALCWILLLGAVLTPVYMQAMLHPTAMSGIVQVFPAGRLDGTAGDPAKEKERKKRVIQAKNWRHAFPSAAYFSLISAVNIGFEQFNPGDWLCRLQAREYAVEAVGWVRVVAGAQALLSVYLLAIWALTQFSSPFE
jgi:hypothetical protein